MEKFTETLRRAINDCGMNRRKIAQRTGVTDSILSRFVRGERGLSSASIDVLMEFLELEVRPRRKRKGE
jgi:transcriptional regulator with XRE-family HTH domain